jgi:hypothetical protein
MDGSLRRKSSEKETFECLSDKIPEYNIFSEKKKFGIKLFVVYVPNIQKSLGNFQHSVV